MKRLFSMLIFLFIIYLGIQFAFTYFGKGEKFSYEIEKNDLVFGVDEKSTFRLEGSQDNYYFNIVVNDATFTFQINHDFNKQTQIVSDVEYFKNKNYECILPIFKGDLILIDILCRTNNEMTFYYNLSSKDADLDRFANGIKLYDSSKWQDKVNSENIEGLNVYSNNLIPDHYIGFTNYRGIYNVSANFNSKVYNIALYKNDERNQKIGIFYKGFYLSADYNEEYEFNKFNVVDLAKLNTYTFASDRKISFDSYIQGVVDGDIYLYDKDNKIQYKINIEKQTVINASSDIKYYDNGTWSTMTISQANNELKFVDNLPDYENKKYNRIDKVGNITGYYYLYLKSNNKYKVYRMNIQDKDKTTYLFETDSIDNMFYINNYVYFVSGSYVKVYHDSFGIKNIVNYNELEFNPNINLNVYVKWVI